MKDSSVAPVLNLLISVVKRILVQNKMKLSRVLKISLFLTLYFLFVLLSEFVTVTFAQNPDPLFELPVQLVGFPVIVLSVRLSQFAKKLAYSLNPNTYRLRSKRDATSLTHDVDLAQKEILREFGPKACILEEPCRIHELSCRKRYQQTEIASPVHHTQMDEILSNNKVQSADMKQWYLLSLFIGDAVCDIPLCQHLAKRMPC